MPVRVDADAQPDLANRYEDYGWPATVVFDAEGRELVKFRGYIAPERMRSMLEGVLADPRPGPSVKAGETDVPDTAPPGLTPALRDELIALHESRYDQEHGGWGFVHKYLDGDAIEYSLDRSQDGARAARDAGQGARHLIDPVWGGLYQYSDGGVWENPHFEKIASFQADGLRAYSLAFARWRDPAHLKAAQDILRYVRTFLRSPQGAFFPSQDADLVPGQHSAAYFGWTTRRAGSRACRASMRTSTRARTRGSSARCSRTTRPAATTARARTPWRPAASSSSSEACPAAATGTTRRIRAGRTWATPRRRGSRSSICSARPATARG